MIVKLQQHQAALKKLDVDKYSNWIMVFPQEINLSSPYSTALCERRKMTGSKKVDTSPVVCDLPNKPGSHVAFACIKGDMSSFELLTLARKLVAEHDAYQSNEIAICVSDFDETQKVFNEFSKEINLTEVVRIKVWNKKSIVLFSDEKKIVGESFPENQRLQKSLKGKMDGPAGELHALALTTKVPE